MFNARDRIHALVRVISYGREERLHSQTNNYVNICALSDTPPRVGFKLPVSAVF